MYEILEVKKRCRDKKRKEIEDFKEKEVLNMRNDHRKKALI